MANFNGDDSPNVFAGGVEADTANGNGGNDILSGGGGSDTLDGGADNDDLYSCEKSPQFNLPWFDNPYTAPVLDTGTEVDTLRGGSGDDRLFAGYGDNVDGGANGGRGDILYISFLGAAAGVVLDFRLATQVVGGGTIQNIEIAAWVQGSDHADDINAGFAAINNSEMGVVFGMGGNDRLLAGYSTILLDGGTGNDFLDGGTGSYQLQTLQGGDGDDTLHAGSTPAKAFGGEGNDTIYASGLISGGGGNDVIVLPVENSGWLVSGDGGDDDISGSSNWANYIAGGEGADIVRGGGFADRLASDGFSDSSNNVDMRLEHDVLTAGAGDDFVTIGFGDEADGGTGSDTLWLSLGGSASGVTLNTQALVSGQAVAIGGGTIQNFENIEYLVGSAYGDTFVIATQAMWMLVSTAGGDDIVTSNGSRVDLYTGEGNDLFYSGSVIDLFNGGAGTDTVDYGSAAAGLVVILGFDGNWHPESGGDTLVYVENVVGTGFADTLTGNELANLLAGSGGDDILTGNAGNDILDGGAGIDAMRGGTDDDIYHIDNGGDSVEENEGAGTDEIRTALASFSLAALADVENLTGTAATAQTLTGNGGNNVVTGGSGNDVLRLDGGGDDTANGGAGNDNIFFIGSLTSADVVNGGAGVDTLVLQGPYGSLTLTAAITQIENVSILGGGNTNFGEPGTNRYDYVLTTHDSNFAAGVQARINGSALLEGEDFTFDGSAETNASFVVYGGKGTDSLTGGLGNDIFFYAEERFASGDTVNGGAGYDGMFLRGNYTIDFNAPGYAGLLTNIENLTLTSATDERYARGGGSEFDYNLILSDAIVGAGRELTVSGTLLMASETMMLDGSGEMDGRFRLFGGAAADTLKGGALADLIHGGFGADILAGGGGADIFRYQAVTESYSVARDHIVDFTPGTDKIELDRIDASRSVGGDQAFSWIGSSAFSNTAGQLRAFQSGAQWIVQGDINGDGFADLIIALTLLGSTPLGAGDFLL